MIHDRSAKARRLENAWLQRQEARSPMKLTGRVFAFEGGLEIDVRDPALGLRIAADPELPSVRYVYAGESLIGTINAGLETEEGRHAWLVSTPHGSFVVFDGFDHAVAVVLHSNYVAPAPN